MQTNNREELQGFFSTHITDFSSILFPKITIGALASFFKQLSERVFKRSLPKGCYWRFKSILFQENSLGTLQGFFHKQMSERVTYSNNCKRTFTKTSIQTNTRECSQTLFSKQIKAGSLQGMLLKFSYQL